MASVYVVTNNVNKKRYVGVVLSATKTVSDRWAQHGTAAGGARYLTRAIAKYGKDKFSIEQVATELSRESALATEKSFISSYCTNDRAKGYNLTLGGEGTAGFTQSAHQRQVVSARMKGVPKTPEQKAKISATKRADPRTKEIAQRIGAEARASGRFKGANNPMYGVRLATWVGRRHSEESRRKMSATRIRLGLGKGDSNPMSRVSVSIRAGVAA